MWSISDARGIIVLFLDMRRHGKTPFRSIFHTVFGDRHKPALTMSLIETNSWFGKRDSKILIGSDMIPLKKLNILKKKRLANDQFDSTNLKRLIIKQRCIKLLHLIH